MENEEIIEHRSRTEKLSYSNKGKFFKLRNFLNIIFILLCLAGMAVYVWWSEEYGGMVLITAVVFKIFECLLRMVG